MSAWIASDKHIASVVLATVKAAEHQRVADLLKRANIRSVNYRYEEKNRITPCDLSQAEELSPEDVVMLAASLDYQSCGRPDWERSNACRTLNAIRAKAGYDLVHSLEERRISKGRWSL